MANDRLRTAILSAGLTVEDVAARVRVDVKTVERWITNDQRQPHRATRMKVAQVVNVDEVHLWPSLAEDVHTRPNGESEVINVFPTRSAVPPALWTDLINGARQQMDVLVFSGSFLVEQYNLLPIVRAKAADGVRFRLAIGDETSSAVIQRGAEEGTTGGLEGRVQLMRRYLQEVAGLPNVEVRAHGTPLYNSIYRFDDQMLVNGHSYGSLAGQNPVLHIRQLPGGLMWRNYMGSFDRVWEDAGT
jgi:transcriptional regulator with XRE-family HTH domain